MSGDMADLHITTGRLHTHMGMLIAALTLIACSSGNTPTSQPPPKTTSSPSFLSIIADTVKGTVKGAFEAAQTPLEDLGLKRQQVPDKLKAITSNPYSIPSPANCQTVEGEISDLDTLLGPDIGNVQEQPIEHGSLSSSWKSVNNLSWQNKGQYAQQGANFAQKAATDTVRNHVTGIIPYRSWLRWISGADAHARKVAEAFEAGKLRRAFLKGFSLNLHCWVAENAPSTVPKADGALSSNKSMEEQAEDTPYSASK